MRRKRKVVNIKYNFALNTANFITFKYIIKKKCKTIGNCHISMKREIYKFIRTLSQNQNSYLPISQQDLKIHFFSLF